MEFLGIVVVVITQAYLWALLGYAYGHKDGKRVGYHRGRSISFNRYKENHGWYAAPIPGSTATIAKPNGAN